MNDYQLNSLINRQKDILKGFSNIDLHIGDGEIQYISDDILINISKCPVNQSMFKSQKFYKDVEYTSYHNTLIEAILDAQGWYEFIGLEKETLTEKELYTVKQYRERTQSISGEYVFNFGLLQNDWSDEEIKEFRRKNGL